MNVYLYVTIIIFVGLLISIFIGKNASRKGGLGGVLLLLLVAPIIGVVLSFPLLEFVSKICGYFKITDQQCIRTDDRTVWVLVYPLVFSPLYFIVMLISKKYACSVESPNK